MLEKKSDIFLQENCRKFDKEGYKTWKIRIITYKNLRIIFVPELKRYVKLKISTSALKSMDKLGLLQYLKKQKSNLSDVI